MIGFAALALITSLLLGIADFLGGSLARRVPLLTVLLLSQIAATLAVVPRIVLEPPGADPLPALWWGAGSGIATAVGVSALYRALAIGTMGVVAPIAALSVLVPVIVGVAGGDALSPFLVAGMVVAIVGTLLASGPELRPAAGGRGSAGPRSILLALVSALGFGGTSLGIALGSRSDVSVTLAANNVATLLVYVVAAIVLRHRPRATGRDLIWMAAIGALGFVGNLCFAVATRSGLLSVVAVLASLFPAVTALLGWWLLRERLTVVQIAGVVCVLAGVAAVAWVAA